MSHETPWFLFFFFWTGPAGRASGFVAVLLAYPTGQKKSTRWSNEDVVDSLARQRLMDNTSLLDGRSFGGREA